MFCTDFVSGIFGIVTDKLALWFGELNSLGGWKRSSNLAFSRQSFELCLLMSFLGYCRKPGGSLALRSFWTFNSVQNCLSSSFVKFLPPWTACLTNRDDRRFSSGDAREAVQQGNGFTRRPSDSWDFEELKTLPKDLRPVPGETLDLILRQKVYLLQSRRGYRANVDSHMLALFASDMYRREVHGMDLGKVRVLDLGAGNGLISILFAKAHELCQVHLVELQPKLAQLARRNLQLNDINGVVTQFDIQNGELPDGLRASFDIVLINPPFYPDGSRKAPKHKEKYLAHQETTASLSDFLNAAHSACDGQNSRAFVAIIHDRKELARLQKVACQNNMVIHDSREMLHVAGEEPSRIMLKVKPRRTVSCSPVEKTSGNDIMRSSSEPEPNGYVHLDQFTPSLPPLILHPGLHSQNVFSAEIEEFLEKLPLPSLRIGRLREIQEE